MGNHQSIWLVHCCFTNILLLGWKDTTWLNSKKKLRFTNCGLLASFAARHTRWMGWNDTMGSPKIGSSLLILKMNSVDLLIHATDPVTILYTHALHNSINVPCWDKTSLPDWFNSCIPKCYPYWLPMNLGSSRYRIRGKNSTLTPFLWLFSPLEIPPFSIGLEKLVSLGVSEHYHDYILYFIYYVLYIIYYILYCIYV